MNQLRLFIVAGLLLSTVLSGCRSNKHDEEHAHHVQEGKITVVKAFARAAIPGSSNSALYMTVLNGLDKAVTLTSVQTVEATSTDLHETVRDNGGVVRMIPQPDGFEIPAGASLVLEPGGKHVMLVDLQADFDSGSEIEVMIDFDGADDQTLMILVQDQDAMRELVETLDTLAVSEIHALDEALGAGEIESGSVKQVQDFAQAFAAVDWRAVAGSSSSMAAVREIGDALSQLDDALQAGDAQRAKPFASTVHDATHDLVEKVSLMQKLDSGNDDEHEH